MHNRKTYPENSGEIILAINDDARPKNLESRKSHLSWRWTCIDMQNEAELSPSDQPKVRCFGSNAALTVEATPLLVKGVPHGHTVNLDVAPRQGENVIWARKITVQLSDTELPIMAAVCLGYLPKAHFKRSGKGIFIERQPNKLFVSATQGSGNAFALPIPIGQTFQVGVLRPSPRNRHQNDDGQMNALFVNSSKNCQIIKNRHR